MQLQTVIWKSGIKLPATIRIGIRIFITAILYINYITQKSIESVNYVYTIIVWCRFISADFHSRMYGSTVYSVHTKAFCQISWSSSVIWCRSYFTESCVRYHPEVMWHLVTWLCISLMKAKTFGKLNCLHGIWFNHALHYNEI